jgi:hypothetical protein
MSLSEFSGVEGDPPCGAQLETARRSRSPKARTPRGNSSDEDGLKIMVLSRKVAARREAA